MSNKPITALVGKLATYLTVPIILILVAGLLAVDYSAAIALMIGAFLSWPVRKILLFAAAKTRRWTWSSWLKIALPLALIALSSLVCLFLFFNFGAIPVSLDCSDGPIVEKYNVIIEPVSSQGGTFMIKETITNPCPVLKHFTNPDRDVIATLPERRANSSSRGLLLEEVSIVPLQSSAGVVNLQLPDGSPLSGPLCASRCPESTIELRDFPKESFYAAKGAEDLTRSSYIDIERITWSVPNLEEGVVFAYVPAPFQYLRPVIEPFVGVSSASQLMVSFFGFAGAVIVTQIVRPVILDNVRKRLNSWLEKRSGVKPQRGIRQPVTPVGLGRQASIVCNWPDGRRETLPLPRDGKFTIGSDPSDDLRVDSTKAARSQVIIRRGRTFYYLEVLEDTFPTTLNRQVITKGARRLNDGDLIQIGDLSIVLIS